MTHVIPLIATHGYWLVGVIVGMESMGIPAPGETALVTAAIYAGTTHRLSIFLLVAAAAIGAIIGDNLGYLIGRCFGYEFLLRHGRRIGVHESRLKLGRLLFDRHGGKVVFFGRFIAVLRALAAALAGAARMDWRRFLVFNAVGGFAWATLYGTAAYLFGDRIRQVHGLLATVGIAVAVLLTVTLFWWLRNHYAALQQEAERVFPGSLSAHPSRS